ncbi:unnamed protein product [Gordionus sp. m RMFG-2023]
MSHNWNVDSVEHVINEHLDDSLSSLCIEIDNNNNSNFNMTDTLMALPLFDIDHKPILYQYHQPEQMISITLTAPTSPAMKIEEESLTYLNQGQPYELKFQGIGGGYKNAKLLKSFVKVAFHDRRLQYCEDKQINLWRIDHPMERILEVDTPLSRGIIEAKNLPYNLNMIEISWDPFKTASVYIKINCISTEFTPKKHGGEKGVPFRLQIDTYSLGQGSFHQIYSAYCQVKIFKPKGADRKHKTDREKFEKQPHIDKCRYQPSCPFTILTETNLDSDFMCKPHTSTPEPPFLPSDNKNIIESSTSHHYILKQSRYTNDIDPDIKQSSHITTTSHMLTQMTPKKLSKNISSQQYQIKSMPEKRRDIFDDLSHNEDDDEDIGRIRNNSSKMLGVKTQINKKRMSDANNISFANVYNKNENSKSIINESSIKECISKDSSSKVTKNLYSCNASSHQTMISFKSEIPYNKMSRSYLKENNIHNEYTNVQEFNSQLSKLSGAHTCSNIIYNDSDLKFLNPIFTKLKESSYLNNNCSSNQNEISDSIYNIVSCENDLELEFDDNNNLNHNNQYIPSNYNNNYLNNSSPYPQILPNDAPSSDTANCTFSALDMRRLSRQDLIEICGVADGIRLNNALQCVPPRPRLILFVSQQSSKLSECDNSTIKIPKDKLIDDPGSNSRGALSSSPASSIQAPTSEENIKDDENIFIGLFLTEPTQRELFDKLCENFGVEKFEKVTQIFLMQRVINSHTNKNNELINEIDTIKYIKILINDNVVQNMADGSRFLFSIINADDSDFIYLYKYE